jgi:nucleoside-diphosphate-sugar epimerase
VARGWKVTGLTRNAAKAALLQTQGVEVVVDDLAASTWHDRVRNVTHGLNAVSSGGGGTAGYRHSYVDGLKSIAAWASRTGLIDTFVYTSSTSVYPQGDGAIVDEAAPTNPQEERSQILVEAENLVRNAPAESWRRWFVLRLAGIYGPERQHLVDQVRSGAVAGTGTHHLNLAHCDDIAAAIWACLLAPPAVRNEIFNVADDGRATRAEIVSWLAKALHVAEPQFSGQPAGERRRVTPDRIIANTKLKTHLGWQPRHSTFREGYASLLSR